MSPALPLCKIQIAETSTTPIWHPRTNWTGRRTATISIRFSELIYAELYAQAVRHKPRGEHRDDLADTVSVRENREIVELVLPLSDGKDPSPFPTDFTKDSLLFQDRRAAAQWQDDMRLWCVGDSDSLEREVKKVIPGSEFGAFIGIDQAIVDEAWASKASSLPIFSDSISYSVLKPNIGFGRTTGFGFWSKQSGPPHFPATPAQPVLEPLPEQQSLAGNQTPTGTNDQGGNQSTIKQSLKRHIVEKIQFLKGKKS